MRVLLVEDEDAIRLALARGLAKRGHEVRTAASYAQALERLAEGPVGCVVTDLKLPDGSGLHVIEAAGAPSVVMSGYAVFDDAVAALRLGCVDFFTKPVALADLGAAIERAERTRLTEAWGVVDLSQQPPATIQSDGQSLQRHPVNSRAWTWDGLAQARRVGAEAIDSAWPVRFQQVVSELLQMVARGRLIVQRWPDRFCALVEADMQRDACAQFDERRAFLQAQAVRSLWRADGVLVECCHG